MAAAATQTPAVSIITPLHMQARAGSSPASQQAAFANHNRAGLKLGKRLDGL